MEETPRELMKEIERFSGLNALFSDTYGILWLQTFDEGEAIYFNASKFPEILEIFKPNRRMV